MSQKLKEQRAELVVKMRALHEAAQKDERAFTSDDDAQWAAMDSELTQIDAAIKRSEKLEQVGKPVPSELRAAHRAIAGEGGDGGEQEDKIDEKRTFNKFLRQGLSELTQEERQFMAGRRDNSTEARAFAAGTSNTGGYTVPQDFRNQLEVALKAYGGMLTTSEIIRTDTGATLPMPTFNYTNVLATIVGENAAGSTDSSTPFGVANLGSFTYRSPILPVSYEFLQDSAFGEGFITEALGQSIARALNAHFTNGTGSGQPRGLLLDTVAGKTGTTGQTTSVIFDDLVDLIHSIDPLYRQGSKFTLADSSLKVVRKLKDSQGRPIFMPGYDGLAGAMADTVLGYEAVINQDMPAMAANAKSIAFGRLDKYKARIVRDASIIRLTERYADNLQVAFIVFMRADGRLLDAGTNPVKHYSNSAT